MIKCVSIKGAFGLDWEWESRMGMGMESMRMGLTEMGMV